jgi:hypothetical protein
MMDETGAIRHRPMETQGEQTRVEGSIAHLHGVAVPALLDARIAQLMSYFSQLTPLGQKRFMALLNDYLYASPSQRKQLRQHWEGVLAQPSACGNHEEHDWMQVPGKR